MAKRTILAALLMGVIASFMAMPVYADREGDALAHVWIWVDPTIAVNVLTPDVDMGSTQHGPFGWCIPFRVDANSQMIYISAMATNLYKGDSPHTSEAPPLPVNIAAGILIGCTDATPMGAEPRLRQYETSPVDFNGYVAWWIIGCNWESGQIGRFSQDVGLCVGWIQPDPEQPMGEYSGFVKILAMIPPA